MKSKFNIFLVFLVILSTLQSCAVAGGIFKAGTATGIIIVVVVIALIIFLVSRAFKK